VTEAGFEITPKTQQASWIKLKKKFTVASGFFFLTKWEILYNQILFYFFCQGFSRPGLFYRKFRGRFWKFRGTLFRRRMTIIIQEFFFQILVVKYSDFIKMKISCKKINDFLIKTFSISTISGFEKMFKLLTKILIFCHGFIFYPNLNFWAKLKFAIKVAIKFAIKFSIKVGKNNFGKQILDIIRKIEKIIYV